MKVFNINSYFYSSSVHSQMNLKLRSKLSKYDVFAPVYKGHKLRKDFEDSVTDVKKIELFSKFDRYFFFIKQNKMINQIEKDYNLYDYDLIHAHTLFTNGYSAMKLAEKYDRPYIVTVRSTDINFFFKYFVHLRGFGKKILKNSSKIIFLSKSARDSIVNLWREDQRDEIFKKSLIIPNGINDFWFENIGKPKSKPVDEVNLLFVGAIRSRKNLVITSKSISRLPFKKRLTVVGPLEEEKELESASRYLDIDYKGILKRKNLIKEFRKADIFILPSKPETFGLVYAEAMTQALPVIYTRRQGFDGQFERGLVGYDVDSESEEEIIHAITNILNNYEEISNNALKNSYKFKWDHIVNKYLELYENVLK